MKGFRRPFENQNQESVDTHLNQTNELGSQKSYDLNEKEAEVYAYKGNNTFIKFTIKLHQAVTILVIISVASNIILLYGPFRESMFGSLALIAFNVASGLISCYFLLQVSSMTKLESMLEIAALLIGGRAIIYFLCVLLFAYYGLNLCMNVAQYAGYMAGFFKIYFGADSERWQVNLFSFSCSLLLLPPSLLRDVSQFKTYGLYLFASYCALIVVVFSWGYSLETEIEPSERISMKTFYESIEDFAIAFQFQCYFLAVYSCLSRENRIKNGHRLALYTSILNVITTLGFCSFLYFSSDSAFSFQDVLIFYSQVPKSFLYFCTFSDIPYFFLQVPLKFLIAKEFALILVDEHRNRSISKKIADLIENQGQGQNNIYSQQMVQKLHCNYYQVIRVPYLSWSKRKLYLATAIVFLCILAVGNLLFFEAQLAFQGESSQFLLIVVYLFVVWSKVLQSFGAPLIIYCFPGYFYYKSFDFTGSIEYFEVKKLKVKFHKKYFGLAFAIFGIALVVFYPVLAINMLSDHFGKGGMFE